MNTVTNHDLSINQGGRPRLELTDDQLAEVETLAAVLNVAQLADYFGIGRTTFFSILNRDADVSERYKRGRARAVGSIAQSLVTKARAGDTTAMIFFLKTQGGWRETVEVEARTAPVDSDAAFLRLSSLLEGVSVQIASPASSGSVVGITKHDPGAGSDL